MRSRGTIVKWNPVITTQLFDRRLFRVVYLGGGLLTLGCSLIALRRYWAESGEGFTGVMGAVGLGFAFVALVVGMRAKIR